MSLVCLYQCKDLGNIKKNNFTISNTFKNVFLTVILIMKEALIWLLLKKLKKLLLIRLVKNYLLVYKNSQLLKL